MANFVIDWEIENYNYVHQFNALDEGVQHYAIVLKDNIKLEYPETLYKFFGITQDNLKTLSENYFYFSSPQKFNDPFDCLSNREKQIINSASNKIKIAEHRQNIGVCCFSTVKDNPLMWGHYSHSFKGFSIQINTSTLFNHDRRIALKSHVSYLKDYKPANQNLRDCYDRLKELQLPAHQERSVRSLLMMHFEYCWKYYDWKYEKEFRAISISSNEFERRFEFDTKIIGEIYIGYRMKIECPEYYNSLIEIVKAKYSHAKIFEVSPNPLYVKLDFKQIEL